MSSNTERMILQQHAERKFHWVGTGDETPLKVAELVNGHISLMNEYIYDSVTNDQVLGIRVDKDPISEEDQATFDLWMTDPTLCHEFRIGDHLYFAVVHKVLTAKEHEAVRNTHPDTSAFILMRVLEIKSKYFSQHAPKDFVTAIANKGFFHGCKPMEEKRDLEVKLNTPVSCKLADWAANLEDFSSEYSLDKFYSLISRAKAVVITAESGDGDEIVVLYLPSSEDLDVVLKFTKLSLEIMGTVYVLVQTPNTAFEITDLNLISAGFTHGLVMRVYRKYKPAVEIAMTKQVLGLSQAAREILLQHRDGIFEKIPNAASTYGLDPEVLADLAIIEARANAPAPASDLYIKHILGAETAAKYGEPNVGDKADK